MAVWLLTLCSFCCAPRLLQEAQALFPSALYPEHTVPQRGVPAPSPLSPGLKSSARVFGKSQNYLWIRVNAQAGRATSGCESASQRVQPSFSGARRLLRDLTGRQAVTPFSTRLLPSPPGGPVLVVLGTLLSCPRRCHLCSFLWFPFALLQSRHTTCGLYVSKRVLMHAVGLRNSTTVS